MTAREPTEAMRETARDITYRAFFGIESGAEWGRWQGIDDDKDSYTQTPAQFIDVIARALLEQDTAARRDVTEARVGERRCWLCSDPIHESIGLTLARDIDAALRTGEPAEPREVCQKCALKVEQFMEPLKTAARLATIGEAVIECGRAATALIAEGRVEASQGAINAANRIRALTPKEPKP